MIKIDRDFETVRESEERERERKRERGGGRERGRGREGGTEKEREEGKCGVWGGGASGERERVGANGRTGAMHTLTQKEGDGEYWRVIYEKASDIG